MSTESRVTSTKIFTDEIDAMYSTLGAEAALPEIRKLAEMKVRSRIPDFDHFLHEELTNDCLLAACSGKFRGVTKDKKIVRFSTWVYQIINNKINNAIRAHMSKRKRESTHRNPCNISRLDGRDRELAYNVFDLRERGMTYKEIARKLNAGGTLAKKTNHVALRRRVSRLRKKMEALPEGNGARKVTPGTEVLIMYSSDVSD